VLEWLNYEEMAKHTAQIGFDGIDLTVRPKGHVLPENVKIDLPKAADHIRKEGLELNLITTRILDANEADAKNILKTASKEGISYYRMGWLRYDKNKSIEKNLRDIGVRLNKLAELNAKYNIHGNYQIHANFLYPNGQLFGCTIWDLYRIMQEVNSEWVGVQYDIRHSTVEAGLSWPLSIELLNPYIQTTVYKDFIWSNDGKVKNVPLGEGMVDWEQYFSMEKEYDIQTPVSIHYEYPLGGANEGDEHISIAPEKIFDALKQDLNFVKKHLNRS
jgi:sugar phosphate isomerase/epimerase